MKSALLGACIGGAVIRRKTVVSISNRLMHKINIFLRSTVPEEVGRKLRSRAKKSIKAVNVLSRRYFCV